MKTAPILAALLAACGLAGLALAEGGHHHHAPAGSSAEAPSTRAFREADARMHRDMAIRYTGDVDTDFVRGMIPHHRGAVDMAKVALAHSKDPEIRRLAEGIVAAQETEIAQMEAFLKRRDATGTR